LTHLPSGTAGSSSSGSTLPAVGDEENIQGLTNDESLQQQLAQLLRQQPYKPTQTKAADLEVNLMHFVQKGPQGRFYLQGKPW
jgi:hypothetical protein